MFRLLIMHASMPRPKLAATHSSYCCAAVLPAAYGSSVFGHRAFGGRELNGFTRQNGVRPIVDESVGGCRGEVWNLA